MKNSTPRNFVFVLLLLCTLILCPDVAAQEAARYKISTARSSPSNSDACNETAYVIKSRHGAPQSQPESQKSRERSQKSREGAPRPVSASDIRSIKLLNEKPSREDLIRAITECTWRDTSDINRILIEFNVWRFNTDGLYGWHKVTDYVPSPSGGGKWDVIEDAELAKFFLQFDNGERMPLLIDKDGYLSVGGLVPHQHLGESPNYNVPALSVKPEVVSKIEELTSHKWKSGDDLTGPKWQVLEFKPDREFFLTIDTAKPPCKGQWQIEDDTILTYILEDSCGWFKGSLPYPQHFRLTAKDCLVKAHWDATKIHLPLSASLFVPYDQTLKKSVVFEEATEPQVSVRVEYDTPIRAGKITEFKVTIQAPVKEDYHQPGPFTLEKFMVIKNTKPIDPQADRMAAMDSSFYDNPWTLTGTSLASIDLSKRSLKEGESYQFSLPVVFAESGPTSFSINAIARGKWYPHQTGYRRLKQFMVNVQ